MAICAKIPNGHVHPRCSAPRAAWSRTQTLRLQVASRVYTGTAGFTKALKAFREIEICSLLRKGAHCLAATFIAASLVVPGSLAKPEGVNRPELLPQGEFTPIIDVAGFLTEGEERRIRTEVENLEKDTGVKLRVLAQNYPQTPGLAIKDYWKVDDITVVFVADPSLGGNILNFNVGTNVDLLVPTNFWSRLAGKYGTKFYWQAKGEGEAIVNTVRPLLDSSCSHWSPKPEQKQWALKEAVLAAVQVSAIDTCFREPPGRLQCSKIQGEFGEESSSGGFGKFFFGS